MKQHHGSRAACNSLTRVAAMMIAGTGLLAGTARSEELSAAPDLSELERAYWACDYTVSIRRVDMATGIACVSISDELKARKFGGDFHALLAWWRDHKDEKYRELAAVERQELAAANAPRKVEPVSP